jgi:hypothetical protein
MRKLGWYSVRVLIKATGTGQPTKLPLYEDRLILIRAASHGEAQSKARKVVQRKEAPYKNSYGNLVRWKVSRVYESVRLFEDEFPVDAAPVDGAQVYWRFISSRNPIKRLKREGTMNAIE